MKYQELLKDKVKCGKHKIHDCGYTFERVIFRTTEEEKKDRRYYVMTLGLVYEVEQDNKGDWYLADQLPDRKLRAKENYDI